MVTDKVSAESIITVGVPLISTGGKLAIVTSGIVKTLTSIGSSILTVGVLITLTSPNTGTGLVTITGNGTFVILTSTGSRDCSQLT